MRVSLLSALAFMTVALTWVGCTDFVDGPEEDYYGSGMLVSQQRTANGMSGVRIIGQGTVNVTQGDSEGLQVEADDNIIDQIITTVENGILIVNMKRGSYHNVTVRVFVTMKNVNELELVGAGDIRTTAPIQTTSFTCRITGAGDISVSGTTTSQTALISGAGSIRNFGLTSSTSSATISGTGTIELTATQRLDGVISGVGTITYDGNPPTVNSIVSGVGSIRRR